MSATTLDLPGYLVGEGIVFPEPYVQAVRRLENYYDCEVIVRGLVVYAVVTNSLDIEDPISGEDIVIDYLSAFRVHESGALTRLAMECREAREVIGAIA